MALAPALVLRRRVVRVPPVERFIEEAPLDLDITLPVSLLLERVGGGTADDTLAVPSADDAGATVTGACDFCID